MCIRDSCYTDHRLDTVWEQDTMSIEALAEGLNCLDHEVIFLGDGVAVYREKLEALLTIPFSFAPAHVNRQRAAAVAALAEVYYKEGKIQTAEEHEPEYLRKSLSLIHILSPIRIWESKEYSPITSPARQVLQERR